MFFDGKLPKMAKAVTDIALVGMFMDEKVKGILCIDMFIPPLCFKMSMWIVFVIHLCCYFAEFTAYKSAAQSLHSRFLLGYVTGETATSL